MSIQLAKTEEERRAIYRLRYEIYVEEMSFFQDAADHGQRLFVDEHDADGRLVDIKDGDELVGTLRMHWGGEVSFPEEFEETYHLSRFESVVPRRDMLVLTRFMLRPRYRGSLLACRLIAEAARFALEKGVKLAFCDCRPNLLNLYQRIGFRPYHKTYNDPGMGLMVPLVMQVEDVAYLKRMRSPVLRFYSKRTFDSALKAEIEPLIPASAGVQSLGSEAAQHWIRIFSSRWAGSGSNLLSDLDDMALARLFRRGHLIECSRGDRIFQTGGTDRTLFLILSGLVELRSQASQRSRKPGCLLGEDCCLMDGRYSADAYAVSEGVRILSLDATALQRSCRASRPAA